MAYSPGFVLYNDKPELDKITLHILKQMQDQFIFVSFTHLDDMDEKDSKEFDNIDEAISNLQLQKSQIIEVTLADKYNTIQYELYPLNGSNHSINIEFWDYDNEVYENDLDSPELKNATKYLCAMVLQSFVQAQSCFFAFMSSHDSKWAGVPDSDEDEYYIAGKIQEYFVQKKYKLFESLFSDITFNTFYLLVLSHEYPNYSQLVEKLSEKYTLFFNESGVSIFENKEWKPVWLLD